MLQIGGDTQPNDVDRAQAARTMTEPSRPPSASPGFLSRLSRFLPQFAFLGTLALGMIMTSVVFRAERQSATAQFERAADLAVERIVSRLQNHFVLLRAAKGLFASEKGMVRRADFVQFLTTIDILDELSGVRGIGYARMIDTGTEALAEAEIAGNYNLPVTVYPATDATYRTPIILIEPMDERNRRALGFDMYSEPTRRAAMERAIATGEPQITGPVELVQETNSERQMGFLIYLPFRPPGDISSGTPVAGFVYAPFRAGDLVRAALASGASLPVAVRLTDAGSPGPALYDDTFTADQAGQHLQRIREVLGRQWVFDLQETAAMNPFQRHLASLFLAMISILFAAATGLALSARQHETAQAKELAEAAAREADYRGLLLQEMKHRIKNHIARIQSIARQSARTATDLRNFVDTFDARLQSMAAAQEILTGNTIPQAGVDAIIRQELRQCLNVTEVDHLMSGPPVRLDERQSHALALVVHELVTNAMKYGGLSGGEARLSVSWRLERKPDQPLPEVVILWVEQTEAAVAAPEGPTGFGSRLIDASVTGELEGTIERQFGPDGVTIELRFPKAAVFVPPPRPAA